MAYVKYENLKTPNEVLEKMCEYVKTRGYTVIEDIKDDLNVWDMSSTDGKKFVFMDKSNNKFHGFSKKISLSRCARYAVRVRVF